LELALRQSRQHVEGPLKGVFYQAAAATKARPAEITNPIRLAAGLIAGNLSDPRQAAIRAEVQAGLEPLVRRRYEPAPVAGGDHDIRVMLGDPMLSRGVYEAMPAPDPERSRTLLAELLEGLVR
jgi:hypothetical protein